jgi:adenine-specific DNA-methyltransferase
VVHPQDPDAFIHIAPSEWDSTVAGVLRGLAGSLAELGLEVSTGRVVDFRVADDLRSDPGTDTVPLLYPVHIREGAVVWPATGSRKPNALRRHEATEALIQPPGHYVLVKRFSSKEERRRVTAAVLTPEAVAGSPVAFENHLNFFHRRGWGMPRSVAAGLTAYLNSTLVDAYLRQFSGHTQINATDLRKLPYPTLVQVTRIGERVNSLELTQLALDDIVEQELLNMPAKQTRTGGAARRRIDQAVKVLTELGLPKEQTNERAALTLLALAGLTPSRTWSKASNPLCGVTPIMEFAAEHYGKSWKPNTRETVRRFTLHQFQDAGIVVANPDQPDRPVNSPAYCYQLPERVLRLLRTVGTPA